MGPRGNPSKSRDSRDLNQVKEVVWIGGKLVHEGSSKFVQHFDGMGPSSPLLQLDPLQVQSEPVQPVQSVQFWPEQPPFTQSVPVQDSSRHCKLWESALLDRQGFWILGASSALKLSRLERKTGGPQVCAIREVKCSEMLLTCGPVQTPLLPQSAPEQPTLMQSLPVHCLLFPHWGPTQPDVTQFGPVQTPLRQSDPLQPTEIHKMPVHWPLWQSGPLH